MRNVNKTRLAAEEKVTPDNIKKERKRKKEKSSSYRLSLLLVLYEECIQAYRIFLLFSVSE
jgi:hypothetical protein